MKLVLNAVEVKEAMETYVKSKYLRDYESFEVEVLDIMNVNGVSLDLENQVTFEIGVAKKTQQAPAPAPMPMPTAITF